jgi:hypothetical protein
MVASTVDLEDATTPAQFFVAEVLVCLGIMRGYIVDDDSLPQVLAYWNAAGVSLIPVAARKLVLVIDAVERPPVVKTGVVIPFRNQRRTPALPGFGVAPA